MLAETDPEVLELPPPPPPQAASSARADAALARENYPNFYLVLFLVDESQGLLSQK
jgi:hypothetical protein